MVYNFLETARTRSIAYASKDIIVPDLEKVEMISSGGADYKDMCAGCHLSPGVESTDFSESLYPKPNFTNVVVDRYKTDAGAQQSFWALSRYYGIRRTSRILLMTTIECGQWSLLLILPELNNQYTMLTTNWMMT